MLRPASYDSSHCNSDTELRHPPPPITLHPSFFVAPFSPL